MQKTFLVDRQGTEGAARTGVLSVGKRQVSTPAFMPCASRAVVRACSPDDLQAVGVEIAVANTWHLHLRPGEEVVASAGGLHAFMSWSGVLATDSGGFQLFSLAGRNDVSEDGVRLTSPLDGSRELLTPESCIAIQEKLGADIAVALDICTSYPVSYEEARLAMERTLRWGQRCLQAHRREDQWLWGVVQGSVYPDLRRRSAEETAALGSTGFGIGGLSVGESRAEMLEALEASIAALPAEAPKWVMGVGTPRDIVEAVLLGADLFDCVLPTRLARHGSVLTAEGPLKIGNAACRTDPRPIEEDCDCLACRRYSRAYLHYLFRLGEAAG
ncbi:MAG: tRNA guanosine(34) transglycosylase Tgt, partial [Armatimonadetes bacterium]|nr:tRNA guanosine(34) transglycosylase Tgt [Armatimonadota bacterium]